MAYCINPMLSLLNPLPASGLLAYVLLSAIIIALCILTGLLLRTLVPKVYGVLTGGRGM
jgi:hypothetical protein